jgi:hypothetical protein
MVGRLADPRARRRKRRAAEISAKDLRTVRQTKCTWSRLIESFSAARISPTRRYRGRPKLALHLDGDAGQIAVPHEIRVLGQLGS